MHVAASSRGGPFSAFYGREIRDFRQLKADRFSEWSCRHDAVFVLLFIVINLRIQFQIIEPNAAKLGFYDCSFQGKLDDEKKPEMR